MEEEYLRCRFHGFKLVDEIVDHYWKNILAIIAEFLNVPVDVIDSL